VPVHLQPLAGLSRRLAISAGEGRLFISCQQAALLGSIHAPGKTGAEDPIFRAKAASNEDLADLPPHAISVNELDPLRDERLLYYQRLLAVGVPVVGRVVAGTCHGADLLFPAMMPKVFAASARDVSGFAWSVAH
jgi:acetyl esterase/lipase